MGDDPRARAVGFLMSLYQRRLASSTYALRRSLENRAKRLADGLERAQDLLQTAPPDIPDPEEIEELEDAARERLEALLEAITLAGNAEQIREEIQELRQLAEDAKAVEGSHQQAKLTRLGDIMRDEGFFDRPDQRLLIFTEFRDTLDYLMDKLNAWGFRAGCIHGGMKPGSRDEPGTRLYSEQQFRDGAIQVLVATEAAGEGINLQCCHILFNYDIPWNPNRLEQRMGRIHRYGQRNDCLIFNFVAANTIEGRVLQRLMDKLQEIRDALDDDAVFNVVGEVLPAAHVERVLRDYYAGKLGDADLEDRLLKDVDEGHFRAICQTALEGLAARKLNLDMLIERRAKAQERRVVPETIARFMKECARDATPGSEAGEWPFACVRAGTHAVRLEEVRARAGLEPRRGGRPVSSPLDGPRHGGSQQPRMGNPRASAVRGVAQERSRARPGCLRQRCLLPLRGARNAGTARLLPGAGGGRARDTSFTSGCSRWSCRRAASPACGSPTCSAI